MTQTLTRLDNLVSWIHCGISNFNSKVDGEYNWEKAVMMGNRIKEFVTLNANSYSFAPSLAIQSALFFGEVLEVQKENIYIHIDNAINKGSHRIMNCIEYHYYEKIHQKMPKEKKKGLVETSI